MPVGLRRRWRSDEIGSTVTRLGGLYGEGLRSYAIRQEALVSHLYQHKQVWAVGYLVRVKPCITWAAYGLGLRAFMSGLIVVAQGYVKEVRTELTVRAPTLLSFVVWNWREAKRLMHG